ncbi:hypothetical protein [Actinomadura gamaensis]|uniref:Secreted protein n=1 Tax=Actinomadura gamaensis TaxID=1763541 RepID=A0ABV9U8R9_9ACTN
MRAVRLQRLPARSWPRALLALLALFAALTLHTDVVAGVEASATAKVHSASSDCDDRDDGPGDHSDPSAVRPASAVPGRPSSVRLPRGFTHVPASDLPRPIHRPRPATPVAVAGRDGRAPGTGTLIALGVSRT